MICKMQPPAVLVAGWLGMAFALASCSQAPEDWTIQGQAMGTSYTVRIPHPPAQMQRDELAALLAAEIERVEALMSTYRPESELSRFNYGSSTDWVPVSVDTATVVAAAQEISRQTGGAFDVTVGPLVELWGFGSRMDVHGRPSEEDIAEAASHVGFQMLDVRQEPPALRKHDPALHVDLSAIAKGYGVDQAGQVLVDLGIEDYMVEIGGDLKAAGYNNKGNPWRIAVERPIPGDQALLEVVAVEDMAIATSGDYRNFFVEGGVLYSHTIDPRTQRPVTHHIASVSVRAASAMLADGWATALLVVGPDGMEIARANEISALMVERLGEELREIPSANW
ncbi:MAG: FAD:protein FMN transferase [Gammaproteobacteria bacterium]|nr:FAD:protein FMN transferase [Gammaproteobacteria bacterium]